MTQPTVALGMAHYRDPGVFFTIQHHRMNDRHAQRIKEFVVFDNTANPTQEEMQGLRNLSGGTGMTLGVDPSINGTSASRNRVVALATADIVIIMDCHVFLPTESIAAVQKYFADPSHRKDILSGPRFDDSLNSVFPVTHFQPQWNAGMWGRWGTAWKTPKGDLFTVLENVALKTCVFRGFAGTLELPPVPDFQFPVQLGYAGHERVLQDLGCQTWAAGARPGDTIEIPGQGLGCFAVWRANWHGFHEAATGFGGEELCIHELYRQKGGKAVCLVDFPWWHNFYRAGGAPYPADNWKKIRNYVLWFDRLGLDKTDIHSEFVNTPHASMSQSDWERLCADPLMFTPSPQAAPTVRDFSLPQPSAAEAETLESVQKWLTTRDRDLNQHIPLLAGLAAQCEAVAEFSGRRDSLIALTACVGAIHSYNDESFDALGLTLEALVAKTTTTGRVRALHRHEPGVSRSLTMPLPEPVDLLFLDTIHTGERAVAELDYHAKRVRRWIAFHDTELFGANGDGGSGMWEALEGWVARNPEWFIYLHTNAQYGMTVLGRLPADKPSRTVALSPAGVGTELKAILTGLGVSLQVGCTCNTTIRSMDLMGSAMCRENFDKFVAHLRDQQRNWGIEAGLQADGVMVKLQTAWTGAKTLAGWGLAWKMLLSGTPDPIPVMLKLAISRAEAKGL